MRDNVAFWKKVYAEYPTTKGLIHDNRDLSIIYEVIDLVPEGQSGERATNKARVERAKEKYRQILRSLAGGGAARTDEEKKVLAFFRGASSSQLLQAVDAVRFQRCLKDHFLDGLVRSGAYLAEIKKIFRGYNLPEDLAYLPHVESSFNYKAYSKFGAAGIWQFTQSTGKRFMTIDYTLDERRDPIRATHAAARFLKENHKKLGSWPLALTAYNHGPNGMMRAKNQHGTYENIFNNYGGKLFGFASRNFYSEFIAAREVAKNYRKYFGNVKLAEPVSFVEVAIPGYAPIKELSRHFKVDLATLAELNPALRAPVFEGRKHVPKGYKLRLPGKNGEMAKLASRMPDKAFADKQQRSRFYQVQKGDSAGAIARKHGVQLEDLIVTNGLNARAAIYVGQNLRIPTRDEKVVLLAKVETTAADIVPAKGMESKKEAREIVTLKAQTVKKAIPPRKKEEPVQQAEAPVVAPEQLAAVVAEKMPQAGKQVEEKIAAPAVAAAEEPAMEGTTVAEEEQAQLDQPEVIDELPKVPLEEPAFNPEVVTADLLVADSRIEKGRSVGFIQVEVGETLGHYADWLQVPTSSIRRLNGLRFGHPIKLDQRLKLEFTKVSKVDFEEKRYEYHKEIEEDFFAVYKIEGARLYRIKSGDNIWRLCQDEFDLPFWLIRKFNTAHDFNNLKLDEQLIIPVVGEIAPQ
ncbi:MAG: transglycosylase SLT domain-containing protein [Proteobacteria bacterium]|nr:transglycosylase SLT domain-containing protein [Pseudomonadota bacterium]MBU4294406.1 transglycosylase SLT domain-containing protein [Pseudomonadota bacterium]MCG2747588.1 transglycosylase SLT domain-containing protein [Desulfobulbaceae bacterium]